MTRARSPVASRRRRKRLFKRAKGFVGNRKNHLRQTLNAVMKAMAYNYEHRKHNKRNFRRLWITRIGVAAKMNGIAYSRMMHGLKQASCDLDRKMLADMAVRDPAGFAAVADVAKAGCKG